MCKLHEGARVCAGLLAATVLYAIAQPGATAQSGWYDSGWRRTSFVNSVTPGSPGAADAYTTNPFAYAYQGQYGAYAGASAYYTRSWQWNGYPNPPCGWLAITRRAIGTIGFFEDPQDPSYGSTAVNTFNGDSMSPSATGSGPPDYDVQYANEPAMDADEISIVASVFVSVANYGHSSAEVTAVRE